MKKRKKKKKKKENEIKTEKRKKEKNKQTNKTLKEKENSALCPPVLKVERNFLTPCRDLQPESRRFATY